MVGSGLLIGLLTGGFPAYAREISQATLVVATTFALTEISFMGISPRAGIRWFLLALGTSYGVLGGLVLAFAAVAPEPAIRDGWVLIAAVPPAIAVVPVTSYLQGDTRRTLISLAILYLLGLLLVPAITYAFTHQSVPLQDLVFQTALLIGLPILVSRPLRRWPKVESFRVSAVCVSFCVLVIAIVGSTRATLLSRTDLLISLSLLSFVRTFVLGSGILVVSRALRLRRAEQVGATAFSSLKNLGLTVVLAFAIFGPDATLPAVVSLVFEIAWIGTLPFLLRSRPAAAAPG